MRPELSDLPRARTALLLVDQINPLQFDGADLLAGPALLAAAAVAAPRARDLTVLRIPAECTAAESPPRKQASLAWMARTLKCHTRPAGEHAG